jgi:hypothetical protein
MLEVIAALLASTFVQSVVVIALWFGAERLAKRFFVSPRPQSSTPDDPLRLAAWEQVDSDHSQRRLVADADKRLATLLEQTTHAVR